ncbi:MAG TPA: hypothetical protein VMB75_05665, partial [Rhodocyclaceae bacterium]|nr:hypothetical protein [Rhodocyclaceae bacterium]
MLKTAFADRPLAAFDYVTVAIATLLMFVWYVPGTTALRLALALVLLALLLWQGRRVGLGATWRAHRSLWLLYLALTAWIVAEALAFGVSQDIVMHEIRGQWLRSGLMGLAGFLLAGVFAARHPRGGPLLVAAVASALVVHVAVHDLYGLWHWVKDGSLPFQQTPLTANYASTSFLTNLLMSLLCAETMVRLLFGHRYLPVAGRWLALLMVLCVFATYSAGARNGTAGFLVLLLSCAAVGLYSRRRALNLPALAGIALVALAALGSFGWLAFKADPRWQTLAETVPIALDTEHNTAWRQAGDFPDGAGLPRLADGRPVGHSNYMRIAWAKEGSLALLGHPLGVGFGRDAFGRAMRLTYPDY